MNILGINNNAINAQSLYRKNAQGLTIGSGSSMSELREALQNRDAQAGGLYAMLGPAAILEIKNNLEIVDPFAHWTERIDWAEWRETSSMNARLQEYSTSA